MRSHAALPTIFVISSPQSDEGLLHQSSAIQNDLTPRRSSVLTGVFEELLEKSYCHLVTF